MTREPFWYLASPYSNYKGGRVAAFEEVSTVAAHLITRGLRIFCPIAHTHPIAVYGNIDDEVGDLDFWLGVDGPFMDAAVGLIVLKMDGWTESEGVKAEIKRFRADQKPILYMEGPLYDEGV